MKKFSLNDSSSWLLICAFSSILNIGCGKSIGIGSIPVLSPNSNIYLNCPLKDQEHWNFVQPSSTHSPVVDLLFVVDTGKSMKNKLEKIASSIPYFLDKLNPSMDFRVGVMLAYGQDTSCIGDLFAGGGSALVLNSKTQTLKQIGDSLQNTLLQAIPDAGAPQGGKLMSTLLASLSPARLSQIQNAGFFRPNATLAVVFISDHENRCNEAIELMSDVHMSQDSVHLADTLYSKLKAVKGQNLLLLAGIIPSHSPQDSQKHDCHGVSELLAKQSNSIFVDINGTNPMNLETWANSISTSVQLQTQFELTGQVPLISSSIRVTVDGIFINSTFESVHRMAQIPLSSAGHDGSTIEVSACTSGNGLFLDELQIQK